MRKSMRWLSSSDSLNRAMRSWMSIAALDRRHCRAELGQHRIARRADQPAAADVDGRTPDVDLCRLEVAEGARLRPLHHPGEAREIGVDDGGEATLHGLFQGRACLARPIEAGVSGP